MESQEIVKVTEKITTKDTTKTEEKPVKIPKKRGRKPKYPPESRQFKIHSEPIIITFD